MQHLHHRQAVVWNDDGGQVCQVGPISHVQANYKVREENQKLCGFVSIYLYIVHFSDVIGWVFAITNKYKQGRKAFEGKDLIENIAEIEAMTMVQEQ